MSTDETEYKCLDHLVTPLSTSRSFFQMWNLIGDGDGVFEMRLRNRNGRKSVSEIHPMGLNTIWRFPHVSRLIGRDITDTVEVWFVDVGGLQWSLSDASIAIISALPSDYMIGTEDELTDEFDDTYPLPSP